MLSPGSLTKMAVLPLSLYNALTLNEAGNIHRMLWKGRIPAKIKIFLWLLENNAAVLTKDNLIKRQPSGDCECCFCDNDKTIAHLFFTCITSKVVWAVVAKAIF